MNITLKQLSVFLAIARHGSMTSAADSLFMTKGAVSQALAELENQLGIRLFDRQHARLLMNHEGHKLLPLADELLARMQDIRHVFGDGGVDKRLRLGCTRTIGSYLLPGMLGAFESENGWLPRAVIGNTQEICGMLNRFEIDVALLEGPVTDPGLVSKPWMEDEMIVLAGKNHPLAKEKPVSFEKLGRERWILREPGSGSRAFFENQLALYLANSQVILSLNAFDAILSCVSRNLGLTFISSRVLGEPLYKGHFVPLHLERRFFRKLTLCHHRNKFISPTLEKWVAFCGMWSDFLTA
ncbi:LysR substrate-binding domain-containing protein [Oxalobacter paraformigenes]|uniref:HTH lysR-type domain-containing protein n=1 Tax=Oxalobacter paraformigenes TaxID=556268 RepID=C3X2J3_9BURK|nr:LysR substrate-binding domain-containing protein [Oxalobacter paraformigenes]EEO27429.1 hypothetical protein OFAG_00582 [Oxalobacter paraformigenes]